jgi:hypothetical protein
VRFSLSKASARSRIPRFAAREQTHSSGDGQASFKRRDDAAPVVHEEQIGVEFGCKRDCRSFTCTEFGH